MFMLQCLGVIADIFALFFWLTVMITQSRVICHMTESGLNSEHFIILRNWHSECIMMRQLKSLVTARLSVELDPVYWEWVCCVAFELYVGFASDMEFGSCSLYVHICLKTKVAFCPSLR